MPKYSFAAEGRHWDGLAVVAVALLLAVVSARPFAGGFHDGSRLATVEALVDHHTFAIDNSIFVQVPNPERNVPSPYPPGYREIQESGTLDKVFIDGHYYSHQPSVPALLLAGVYQVWQTTTGLTARQRPDLFCLLMTLASSGLAYVIAVGCIYRIGGALGLARPTRQALTVSFAFCTVALPYTEFVNNHILLLGILTPLMLGLVRVAEARAAGRVPWGWLAVLGTLTGLGYTIDLGFGPVLIVCAAPLVMFRCPRLVPLAAFALAIVPWLVLHHAINYAIGGTLLPLGAVPAYFDWPGSPWKADVLTGGWKHTDVSSFVVYALTMLEGQHGFLGHNLPLLLLVPSLGLLLRRGAERPEVLFALALCGGVWLMYSVNSNNYGGGCLSIRWFVPLLVPAYYLLGVVLARNPGAVGSLLILSAGGLLIAADGWRRGPWLPTHPTPYWLAQTAGLVAWAGYIGWRFSQRGAARRSAEELEVAPVGRIE